MTAQENAELIRSGYKAFADGDLETVGKLFAPDIRWHIGGRSAISGTYTGHDEVFGFFGKLFEETGGTFRIDIHDVLASEDHVVVLARESATRGDRRLEMNEAHIWHVSEGLAKEFWGIAEDQDEASSFFE
jgi:ketosteroid isomerase-like protein